MSLAALTALLLAVHGPVGPDSLPDPAFCRGPDSLGVRVTFFDVGQGASTLLESPGGRNVLVDGGRSAYLASELLTSRGVRAVDLMVATHHHADHIGGLPLLFTALSVSNLLENGVPATTETYAALVRAASGAEVRVLEASARTLTVGELALRVLPPLPWRAGGGQNDRSLGLVAEYGAFRAIFSGDAEVATLREWLATQRIPTATVVLAGHHGSDDATTPEWVRATSPAVVVISVGATNGYGHPSPQVLALWTAPERVILRTDVHGTIALRGCADGSYTLSTSRGAPR